MVRGADAAPGKASVIDTRFIPAGAFGAYVAYPARVLSSPALAKLDLKDVFGSMEQELGFRVRDIERAEILFILGPPQSGTQGNPANQIGLEIRLTKPQGGAAAFVRAASHTEPIEARYEGKTYYKPGKDKAGSEPSWPAVYLVDDRTILMAEEPVLKEMIAARGTKSPLAETLAKVDATADLSYVLINDEPFRKMIAHDSKGHHFAPPQRLGLDALDLMSRVIVSIKTTPEISLTLTMQANNEAAAEKLAAMVPQFKKMLEGVIPAIRQEAAAVPPKKKAAAEFCVEKLDKIAARLNPQRKGKVVVVQIDGLGTVADLAPKLLILTPSATDEDSTRVQSLNNLKLLGLAMLSYHIQYQSLPAHAIYSKEGKPLLSWRVSILPVLAQQALYNKFHLDEPWDSPNNKPLIAEMPLVFADPAGKSVGKGKTRYVVPVGKGTIFDGKKGISIEQIKDGSSNTILILEVGAEKAVVWTKPEDMPFDPATPLANLGKISAAGFNTAFADGHLQTLRKTLDSDTFRKLILRADGEVIDSSKF